MKKPKRKPSMQAVIDAMPGTKASITVATGLNRSTVGRWIEYLLQSGRIRIERWVDTKSPAQQAALYTTDAGPSYTNPGKYTEIVKEYVDLDKHKKQIRQERERRKPVKRDALTAAFFGEHVK